MQVEILARWLLATREEREEMQETAQAGKRLGKVLHTVVMDHILIYKPKQPDRDYFEKHDRPLNRVWDFATPQAMQPAQHPHKPQNPPTHVQPIFPTKPANLILYLPSLYLLYILCILFPCFFVNSS